MNELILNYVILFILLEFYEINWQKADTVMGMLIRMHKQYSRSIFLFLVMHPTFYFSIGFVMLSDYNMYAMILLFVKTLDVAIKIRLIEQVFVKKELTQELGVLLLSPINGILPYIGLLIYPPLVLLALF
jgi:hypothetical protein